MASVTLKNLSKIFDDGTTVVDNVSLVIPDGQFCVIVGPSGCGKSTTLRMIAGLEEITSGEVIIDGTVVNYLPPKDRDIAMVFQNYALYPHMTVRENLAFALKMRKLLIVDINKRVEEVAKMLELEPLMDRKPKSLSGGQRQRVALGRAIVRNPKVFLFDEPLSNLDAKLRTQTRTEIQKLHGELRTTSIYVTHDQVEAMTMGDVIVVMYEGKVQQISSPNQIYKHPVNRFVASFIGTPAMNIFEGSIIESDGMYIFMQNNISIKIPLSNVIDNYSLVKSIGIRAEHFEICASDDPNSFKVMVAVIELLGYQTLAYFSFGKTLISAVVSSDINLKRGETIYLKIETNKIFFFDIYGKNLNI
ncbi:MAG: sn-glycerol-3-phosphate ABC transporter ATP-binding protein UgpC [Chlorobiota bacterium]|jgi:multiple sugar transport system ATP-binding protein|nr:MAG: sn-glycerol-3-phosphate ABC transporter ATP-binding protein UgpC [Chlorobiota bacterium]